MSRSFRGRPTPDEEPEMVEEESDQEWANRTAQRYRDAGKPNAKKTPATQGKRGVTFSAFNKYGDDEMLAVDPAQVDIGKRLVAVLIDVFAGYLLGMFVNCIPFINMYIHDQLVMVVFLIVRDSLFGGRGVGKNLMGLQVVDIKTGEACSLIQSIKRNAIIFGPYMVLYFSNLALHIFPNELVSTVVTNALQGVGAVYTLGVIPYECYRVYSRVDGLRWGDQFAGTATIPADMDFSNPLSR
jgi:hypothetical protein